MSKTKIVFFGGSKGGVGKSTTSHLACLGAILCNQAAAYVLTDPDRKIRDKGRPYDVLDGTDPKQLAQILKASQSTSDGWLIIDGGGNRPAFDSAIAEEADLCIFSFRPSHTPGNDGPLFTGRQDVEYRQSRHDGAEKDATKIEEGDLVTGEIYILRSLSTNPAVSALEGRLFQIGFTTGDVEERILAAKGDPTFLLAAVKPIKTYSVCNMNTVKMENLLHRFFCDARLDIEIMDRFGKPVRPREWFLVSLEVVDKAISMLIDGSIVGYRYDRDSGQILPASHKE
jgi:hypothetical protein